MNNIKMFISMLKQIIKIMNQEQKKRCLGVFFVMLIAAMFELMGISVMIPFILSAIQPEEFLEIKIVREISNRFQINGTFNMILIMSIGVMLVYLLKTIVVLYSNYIQVRFCNELGRDVSILMMKSYLKRPYTYYLEINSAEILRSVSKDIDGVIRVADGFLRILTEGITCLLIGIFLIMLNPVVAFILLGIVSLSSLIIIYLFKLKVKRLGEKSRFYAMERYKYVTQAVNGIKEISVMQRKEIFAKQYEKASVKQYECEIGHEFACKVPYKTIEFVFVVAIILLVIIGIGNEMNIIALIPQLGAIVFSCVRLLPSISAMASSVNTLVFYRNTLEDTYGNYIAVQNYGKMESIAVQQKNEIIYDSEKLFCKSVNIKSINWKYNKSKTNIIENLSLEIKKNDIIAFVGKSGVGKTTLVDIILGLLRPQEGTVDVDGVDIFAIPTTWAKIVGYVPQVVFLIDDTVRSNILFGAEPEDKGDQAVWEALEQAQLKTFVEQLPDGLDTIVGERGIKFSGGQRQRIAIARALYNNPAILVLDEATSALDHETEVAVMEAIDALKGHKTLIVVAHRLSTIKNCDKIYEIMDGKAVLVDKKIIINET